MKHVSLKLILSIVLVMTAVNTAGRADGIIDTSFDLIDETGQAVTMQSYAGYYRLVFFGYTFCPDICPTTLYYIATALKLLGPAAAKIKVLFISIDPKRDTLELLARYTDAFHPAITGLTGSYAQVAAVVTGFRATFGYSVIADGKEKLLDREAYAAIPADALYTPFHSSQIYLLDTDGELLDVIGYGSLPDFIAARLRQYITD